MIGMHIVLLDLFIYFPIKNLQQSTFEGERKNDHTPFKKICREKCAKGFQLRIVKNQLILFMFALH